MGFSSPLGNLKHFISGRPQIVVFTLCLATFALTTYSLAYYINRSENVRNPEYPMDWNDIMSHLAELSLCLHGLNESEPEFLPHPSALLNSTSLVFEEKVDKSQFSLSPPSLNVKQNPKDTAGGNRVTVSLEVLMTLRLLKESSSSFQNFSTIQGVVHGNHLRTSDPEKSGNASLNVTFHAPGRFWRQSGKTICVILEGPAHLLPATSSPKECPVDISHTTDEESITTFTVHGKAKGDDGICAEGTVAANMEYTPDPELSFYLTARDRSVINLHLLHTSYFLFVLVMTMACYALVRGRPSQKQGPPSDMVHIIGDL